MKSVADCIAEIDEWMLALGAAFIGRRTERVVAEQAAAWAIKSKGRTLVLAIDTDFPFSRPRVAIEGYDRGQPEPHVESGGLLCLSNIEIPSDPLLSVKSALGQASQLLTENAEGLHDDDFVDDFTLYWNNLAADPRRVVHVLPSDLGTGFCSYVHERGAHYCFSTKDKLQAWWKNLDGNAAVGVRQGAIFRINPLPAPSHFPSSGKNLWQLISDRCDDGDVVLNGVLKQMPKSVLILLAGVTPSGRSHVVAVELVRTSEKKWALQKKLRAEQRAMDGIPSEALCSLYELTPCQTIRMDAAESRLPDPVSQFKGKKVAIVGCGALGSGVARLLGQSGIGNFTFVDHETLAWENIRRHELGASFQGMSKVEALAHKMKRDLPMIDRIATFATKIGNLLRENPQSLADCDLIVCCTGSTSTDRFLEGHVRESGVETPIVFGWLEAHATAAHAFLNWGEGPSLVDGLDAHGNFLLLASDGGKPPPPECGAITSPFGAVELANGQALVSRLCIDILRGNLKKSVWRTWLGDDAVLSAAEAQWTEAWIARNGQPSPYGQTTECDWAFP